MKLCVYLTFGFSPLCNYVITQLREKNKFVLTICSGISVGRKVAECPSCPSGDTSAARAFNLDGNHDDDGDDDGGDNDGNDDADGCDDDGNDGDDGGGL